MYPEEFANHPSEPETSAPGALSAPLEPAVEDIRGAPVFPWPIPVYVVARQKQRYWLHGLLFLTTIFTTLMVGARVQQNFERGLPMLHDPGDLFPLSWVLQRPTRLLMGIPFSATLMSILLAHEMGHFLYCRRRGVAASLPYFIPAPTLAGTMGALIRIRSRIPDRKALFDIGIAGPVGGMLVAIPATVAGIMLSQPAAADPDAGLVLGTPLLFRFLGALLRPGIARPLFNHVLPHPVLIACWIGALVTALNLLPGGQLDGGHILYALWPSHHRQITLAVGIALLAVGMFSWPGWILWGAILLLFRHHPPIMSTPALDRPRKLWACVALVLFVGTFAMNPFPGISTIDLVRQAIKQ